MNLNVLALEIHRNALEHGWWPAEGESTAETLQQEFAAKLCLVHAEVSEALEEFRDHHALADVRMVNPDTHTVTEEPANVYSARLGIKPEGIPIELADVLIRVLDMCGAYSIDIEKAVRIKMEFNKTRPHKHGGKRI